VESAVFFDELVRSGRDKQLSNPDRANGFRSSRLIPAVEYLQGQRARTMMMMKLAEATAEVDVYLVPTNSGGGGGMGRGGPAAATDVTGRSGGSAAPNPTPRQNATNRHFAMANSAGYPAVSVPNGFTEMGTPTAICFYARPFGETRLLALAKAYQDASGFHQKRPNLDAATAAQSSAL
jgi:Asp-tRNA(Asn)/Glu-tRNA(Gln) amidotransferase A subunit family amidase